MIVRILFTYLLLFSSTAFALNHCGENWIAEDYVANGLLQFKWAKKFLFDRYTWSGNEQILDIGCGDGRITNLIAKCIPSGKVLGIDCSMSMIHYAREKYCDYPNLRFELAQATDSFFYEDHVSQFDLIVSFHCLHWFEDQNAVLMGIKKSLKPEGKAFLRLTSKGWDPVQEVADELIKSEKWGLHFTTFKDPVQRFNIEEYSTLVRNVGLELIEIREAIENDLLQNPAVLAKQIKSWLPHIKHLPAEFQEEYLDDVVNAYLMKVPPKEDGIIHLYDCYLEVELKWAISTTPLGSNIPIK